MAIVPKMSTPTQALSQTERLRRHLEAGKPINPLEAWQRLGIYRLSARVLDLRADGLNVRGEFVEVRNQFGEKCRVKQYSVGRV